jgi:hypothetical protein
MRFGHQAQHEIVNDGQIVNGCVVLEAGLVLMQGHIPGLRDAISKVSEAEVPTATASTQSGMLQMTPVPATVSPASTSPTATPGIVLANNGSSSWLDKFAYDPAGSTLSVLVLVGMLGSIVWAVSLFKKNQRRVIERKIGVDHSHIVHYWIRCRRLPRVR